MEDEPSESFCHDVVKNHDYSKLERPVYVIQEHHASKLHWDLRFEMNGTLKSWALPKEPPQKIGEKRLAISVDDHPVGYALFEGQIPAGNYGAGLVKIWDGGTFEIVENSDRKIVVNIHGSRLQGKYCLVHFEAEEKNWLFFKMKYDSR
ncbi:DNA polymerase ligase N-terminal domain-containing protein [Candidatus Nitrosotalea okcheonensis]|uniref:DNA ligase D-like 3'-phosphoesterase domain-containing protein (Modular protein) n=1 Tax=Candidatus Nitrosotalea okcheonensis TaxID=1903276 RepID=A0A2H1FCP1_9ARCH|nr:DNA polymerase ligase N-terminal domain-containing protein [Candidatus Nitrosotalea okcheonensis]MDE1831680.1 3'-phosphoesterase [Nitrososphaerota archaeon]MDE1840570.1 3'-phosphoesterase [Nitrososphaerota archaeon]MDE1877234.1 3'-phosphoesterase [Nitrososphaerota archaeon]SMH70534.1 DNA ligase D-like 3'-phosphoesterase domain-containing protein (modular protein) [Candidatus Nitrosotalea okcheonensis]